MKNKIYNESGHSLTWAKFVEVGCPAKKEDYFLTEKDVLNLDIVKDKLSLQKKEIIERLRQKATEGFGIMKKPGVNRGIFNSQAEYEAYCDGYNDKGIELDQAIKQAKENINEK